MRVTAPTPLDRLKTGYDTSKQMVDLLFFFDPGQKQLVAVLTGRKNFYVFHDDGDPSFIGVIFQFDKSAYSA